MIFNVLKARILKLIPVSGPIVFAAGSFLMSAYIQQTAHSSAMFAKFAFIQVLLATSSNFINGATTVPLTFMNAEGASVKNIIKLYFLTIFVMSAVYGSVISLSLFEKGAGVQSVLSLGILVVAYNLRWFQRGVALSRGDRYTPAFSDYIYFISITIFVIYFIFISSVSFQVCIMAYAFSIVLSSCVYFREFLSIIIYRGGEEGVSYLEVLRTKSMWSVGTVLTTDLGSNSHTYAINFFLGNAAYAPVALAVLLLRPIGLLQTAVIQLESYTFFRLVSERSWGDLRARVTRQVVGLLSFALVYIFACLVGISLFQAAVLRGQYSFGDVVWSVGTLGVVLCSKVVREPMLVVLQKAKGLQYVARMTAGFSSASVLVTVFVMMRSHPIATDALLGIACSEVVFCTFVTLVFRRVAKRP